MREPKKYFSYIAAIGSCALAIFGGIKTWQTSELFMPEEYKTIKRVFNKLAAKNDLGDIPITFTVIPGNQAKWRAEQLNLCKEDDCSFYANLNPFKSYRGKNSTEVNEIIRQAYLLTGIEGTAWWHGAITISRSSFPLYEGKDDYFACLLGHELAHVVQHHEFKQNLLAGREGKDLKEEERELLESKIGREQESEADIYGLRLVTNSGFPKDTCLKEHDWHSEISGYGEETKEDSTHPGYDDRIAVIRTFVKSYNPNSEDELRGKTTGKWKYNRDLNTLRFIPN